MAQFQILCPHSEAEWRPITIEFIFAPNGDQQYLWPSFEEAEAARKQLLLRAPDVQLRIALAGADIGDVDWPVREKLRFADGSYAPTPWHDEPWYREKHDEHFCHVSTEQAGKIAFTENAAKGQIDRQLVMSPGRYLHRFFSAHLDNNAIEGWCARLSVQLEEDALKITQDADEIEDVYVGGPGSCMAHDASEFDSFCHPTRVYAGPDTAIAYIGPRDDARARSVVWPERKIYTSLYGDVSRLRLLLENAGYAKGGLNGARIRRIVDGDSFVVPYIDAGDDGTARGAPAKRPRTTRSITATAHRKSGATAASPITPSSVITTGARTATPKPSSRFSPMATSMMFSKTMWKHLARSISTIAANGGSKAAAAGATPPANGSTPTISPNIMANGSAPIIFPSPSTMTTRRSPTPMSSPMTGFDMKWPRSRSRSPNGRRPGSVPATSG